MNRRKQCKICSLNEYKALACEGRTRSIRAFYIKLAQNCLMEIYKKARSYNYKSLNLCSEVHQKEAHLLFFIWHRNSTLEYKRRSEALESANTLLYQQKLKLANLELHDVRPDVRAKEEARLQHYIILQAQRKRRLNELTNQ